MAWGRTFLLSADGPPGKKPATMYLPCTLDPVQMAAADAEEAHRLGSRLADCSPEPDDDLRAAVRRAYLAAGVHADDADHATFAWARHYRSAFEALVAAEEVAETVATAVGKSQDTDGVVRLAWSEELEAELLSLADDSAENGDEVEFWGRATNDYGAAHGDWRVHLVRGGR